MTTTRRRFWLIVVVGLFTMAWCSIPAHAYRLAQRWATTASGATGALGSPMTLTWSLVPDGTFIDSSLAPSDLIAFFDTNFGGGSGDIQDRPWFGYLESVFDRWSQLSGVTYVYEPADDGVGIGTFPGLLEVRGDIRLGGTFIDGMGDAVGFAFQPSNGDMVLDTAELNLFTNPENNFLGLRSVMMHEHGHSLGFRHVESDDSAFLMEDFVNTSFDGPQLDDIRGVHRAYGDALEKSNDGQGNNSASTAISIGALSPGSMFSVGNDAVADTSVDPHDTDFISIDDNTDFDFFSFDVITDSEVDLVLNPVGPTYLEGPGGGPELPVDSSAVSDLTLALFAPDGMTLLATSNSGAVGESESILGFEVLETGRYFARVSGAANDVQLYQLTVSNTAVPEPTLGLLMVQLGLLLILRRRSLRSTSPALSRENARVT